MAMKKTAFGGSFVNGQPVWNNSLIADIDGERGSFTVPTPATHKSPYSLGDIVNVDFGPTTTMGVVTRITTTTTESEVEWHSPLTLKTRRFGGAWDGWKPNEIIDLFAKELALKRPA